MSVGAYVPGAQRQRSLDVFLSIQKWMKIVASTRTRLRDIAYTMIGLQIGWLVVGTAHNCRPFSVLKQGVMDVAAAMS